LKAPGDNLIFPAAKELLFYPIYADCQIAEKRGRSLRGHPFLLLHIKKHKRVFPSGASPFVFIREGFNLLGDSLGGFA